MWTDDYQLSVKKIKRLNINFTFFKKQLRLNCNTNVEVAKGNDDKTHFKTIRISNNFFTTYIASSQ